MTTIGDQLPAYLFLTAFSQMVSRICHSNDDVYEVLEAIMFNVGDRYPEQTLWGLMSSRKAPSASPRRKRCDRLLKKLSMKSKAMIDNTVKLADTFCMIAHQDADKAGPKVYKDLRKLPPMENVIIPLQRSITVTLPVSTQVMENVRPFPSRLPTIRRIDENVEILQSMQKPKKIKLIGNDGASYLFLCKGKDDLRKDCRFMEFAGIVNKVLMQDVEARRRQLRKVDE